MRMMAAVFLLGSTAAVGQFDLQNSGTTASLRGIDAVGAGVAWASGTGGTVIRTEDGGYLWQRCAVPKGAEKLDFRGVQAFDANTAVVMASGKGEASSIWKTTDGCQTWKKVFDNPDKGGFFDAMRKVIGKQIYMVGDPVDGKFQVFLSLDQGSTWFVTDDGGLEAQKGDGAFAASNTSLTSIAGTMWFGMGGTDKPRVYGTYAKCAAGAAADMACPMAWRAVEVPMAEGSAGAGVFSVAGRTVAGGSGKISASLVAVGGDFEKAGVSAGSAAWSRDGGLTWSAATTPPGGYRSAVAFDRKDLTWLAVGPNGADVSRDDGKTWTALTGETAAGWNAISLPFVVGPKGRVGKLVEGSKSK